MMEAGDIVAVRSDAIPGVFSCIECGMRFGNLMEAWRDNSSLNAGMSALFCEPCAMRIRAGSGLNLAPIQLSNLDKLNFGIPVESFGRTETPVAMAKADPKEKRVAEPVMAESGVTGMAKWKNILDK